MADGKIRLKIDTDIKESQKELKKLTESFKNLENTYEGLVNEYQKKKKVFESTIASEQKNISEINDKYDKQQKQLDAIIAKYKNIEKASAFYNEQVGNKRGRGLIAMNFKKWGVTTDAVKQYQSLSASLKGRGKSGEELESLVKIKLAKQEINRLEDEYSSKIKASYAILEESAEKIRQTNQKITNQKGSQAAVELVNKLLPKLAAIIAKVIDIVKMAKNIKVVVEAIAAALGISAGWVAAIVVAVAAVIAYIAVIIKLTKLLFKLLTAIAKIIGKVLVATAKLLAKIIAGIFSGAIDAVKNLKARLSSFFKLIKRNILLGIMRPLRSAVSDAVNYVGKLLKANSDLSVSLQRLKGAALTAFEPLYNIIVPILVKVINAITKIITYISSFLSALFNIPKASKKSAQALAQVAEETNSLFASWDTIQQLDSGSKSGGDTLSPLFDFDLPDLDNFKDALDKLGWEGIGELIGKKFGSILKSLDTWINTTFRSKLGAVATHLAELLNGTISAALNNEVSLGTVAADYLNSLFNALGNFSSTLNWKSLGELIAKEINDFLATFDWEGNASKLGEFIENLFISLKNTIESTDWAALGTNLAKALFSFKIGDVLTAISDTLIVLANGVVDAIWAFFVESSAHPDEEQVGFAAANFINNLVNGLLSLIKGGEEENKFETVVTEIIRQIKLFFEQLDTEKLGELISAICDVLFLCIDAGIKIIPWETLSEKIVEFINGLVKKADDPEWMAFKKALKDVVEAAFNFVFDFLRPIVVDIGSKLAGALLEGFKNYIKSNTSGLLLNILLGKPVADSYRNMADELNSREYKPYTPQSKKSTVNPAVPFMDLKERVMRDPQANAASYSSPTFASANNAASGGDIVLQMDGTTLARVASPYFTEESSRLGRKITR